MPGWTTANPTIYRAGLAFQAIMPRVSRVRVTLVTGFIATLAGVFPAFAWKLLGFVGLYGTILAPIGAIIFFDWYFVRKGDPDRLHQTHPTRSFSLPVLLAWVIPVSIAFVVMQIKGISAWYFPLPCWLASGLLFLAFTRNSFSLRT